ncbi:MAG: transcription termination/antitermination NusG family protein, partial [Bacteroidota bacterium]
MAKEWYVIRAISGKEKKVKEYLESEISRMQIGDWISQVLIPTEKVFEMRNGKKKLRERSFLPGYILAECDMNPDLASMIREVPNV